MKTWLLSLNSIKEKGNDILRHMKTRNAKQNIAQISLVIKKQDFDFLPRFAWLEYALIQTPC